MRYAWIISSGFLFERDGHRRDVGGDQAVAHLQLLDRELRPRPHVALVAFRILELHDAAFEVDGGDGDDGLDGDSGDAARYLIGPRLRAHDGDGRRDDSAARGLVFEEEPLAQIHLDGIAQRDLVEALQFRRYLDRLRPAVLELQGEIAAGGVLPEHGGAELLRAGRLGLARGTRRLNVDRRRLRHRNARGEKA